MGHFLPSIVAEKQTFERPVIHAFRLSKNNTLHDDQALYGASNNHLTNGHSGVIQVD